MAGKIKTWVWVIVSIVVICILGAVAVAGMGYYFFTKHFDTKVTSPASATVEFEQVKAQFAGQKPLIELDERGRFLSANPDRPGRRDTPPPGSALRPRLRSRRRAHRQSDDSVLAAAPEVARHDRLQRRPARARGSEVDGRRPRAFRPDPHRRPQEHGRRACPRLVAVTVLSPRLADPTSKFSGRNPSWHAGPDSCDHQSRLGLDRDAPIRPRPEVTMKRLFLVSAFGVVGLALAVAGRRATHRRDRSNRPSYTDEAPAAVQRVAARRVRQRLSRRRQGGRARRARARRLQLSGRADVAARRQGLSPELRRLGPLSAVVPNGLRAATRTGIGACARLRLRGNGGVYPNTRGGYGYPQGTTRGRLSD